MFSKNEVYSFNFLVDFNLGEHPVELEPNSNHLASCSISLRHISSFRYSLSSCLALQTLLLWESNSTLGLLTSPLLKTTCGFQRNPFFFSLCRGWSSHSTVLNQVLFLIFINDLWLSQQSDLMMTSPSAGTFLIIRTDRLEPLPSLQTLTQSQNRHVLGICLSILKNITLSRSLSKNTVWNPPPHSTYFLNNPLEEFSFSNSWVS